MNSTKKRIISLMTAGMLTGVLGMYDGINTIFDYQETKEVSSLKEKGISAVKTLETLERERNWITPLPKIDYSSEKLKPYLDSLTNFYAHNDEKIKTLDDAITIVKSDLETITNNPVYLRDRSEVKQMERNAEMHFFGGFGLILVSLCYGIESLVSNKSKDEGKK